MAVSDELLIIITMYAINYIGILMCGKTKSWVRKFFGGAIFILLGAGLLAMYPNVTSSFIAFSVSLIYGLMILLSMLKRELSDVGGK